MRSFVREITWLSMVETGWGNGYVVIPQGHPLHGKHYEEIEIEVHGGLTFSKNADELGWDEILPEDKGCWIIGFDCAHVDDTLENWPKEAVKAETEALLIKGKNIS